MFKRALGSEETSTQDSPEPKRAKKNQKKGKEHQNAHIDPTWGQKYVFSGGKDATTIPAGEEDDFEDDTDAMAYLMSVRTEAGSIPHLLGGPQTFGPQLPPEMEHAQHDDIQDQGEGEANAAAPVQAARQNDIHDEDRYDASDADDKFEDDEYAYADDRGWYEDGAYISYDLQPTSNGHRDAEHPSKALEEAYFESLLRKYISTRKTLNRKPSPGAEKSLPPFTPTHAEPFTRGSGTTSLWTSTIIDRDPIPLQVALMSKDSIFLVLRVLLGGKLLRRSQPLPERTSRWLWALLARAPERNELTHYELGLIRDIGKRAVLLGRSLAEVEALQEAGVGEETGDVEEPADDAVDTEIGEPQQSPGEDAAIAYDLPENTNVDIEDGEVEASEGEDVAMEIESGSEDGEIDEGQVDESLGLEEARKRLLAQLDESELEAKAHRDAEEAKNRAAMNQRATINMVLTITGEFYGQRDLLEFREPFGSS